MKQDYPNMPGFKALGPSQEAALAVAVAAKTLRAKVLETIAAAPAGLSADAVAELLNASILAVRPRISELHRAGDIRRSNARVTNSSGMRATVWVLSPPLHGDVSAESTPSSGGAR